MNILECSSKGDKRFSAFYAKIKAFGKMDSIENHYQLCKRFGNFVPKNWKDAKGKVPTHIVLNKMELDVSYLQMWYELLWLKYLDSNSNLVSYASQFDDFNDMFKSKKSINCQADIIRKYVKNGRDVILSDCDKLIQKLKNN